MLVLNMEKHLEQQPMIKVNRTGDRPTITYMI